VGYGMKKGAAVGPLSPPVLMLRKNAIIIIIATNSNNCPARRCPQRFSSLRLRSVLGPLAGGHRRYPNLLPRIPNTRRANKSSTGPESVRSMSKSRTQSPEGLYPASFSASKSSPRRPSLASIFHNIGGSKRPVSVSVDDPVVPSSATTATDTEDG
jgi:hypothetical protein